MRKNFIAFSLLRNPITNTLHFLFTVIFVAILLLPVQKVFGQTMEGGNYKLHLQEVLDTDPTSTPPLQNNIIPSPTPPPIESSGQSSVLLSDDFINFGPLSPTNPVIRQISFVIKAQNVPFSLYQQMDHDLLNDPGEHIPPTTCDNGSCSDKQASLWNSTLTYGLGVRCDNVKETTCPDDFIEKDTFRPLGQSVNNAASTIASGTIKEQVSLRLTYKLVVSGTQSPGNYAGTATYILVPGI